MFGLKKRQEKEEDNVDTNTPDKSVQESDDEDTSVKMAESIINEEKKRPAYIRARTEEGYIHVRAIIEMLGKPKEHLLQTLKDYVVKLDENENYDLLSHEYSEAEPQESLFSLFAEVEFLVKGTEQLAWFCFDYMPSSIEILEPASLTYKAQHMTDFMNDLLQRLHHLDMSFKTSNAKIKRLNDNSEALLKNFIGHILNQEDKTLDELSKTLGIGEENLKNLLNRLIGEGYLSKDGEKYALSKKNQT